MSSIVRQIGQRYEIERLLGSGAVGRVYLGHDRHTGEPVAIKELMSDWVSMNMGRQTSSVRAKPY